MSVIRLPRRQNILPNGRVDVRPEFQEGLVDAWIGRDLLNGSVLGRAPSYTPSGGLVSVTGVWGQGVCASNGSVRYDVGEWGEQGPYTVIVLAEIYSGSFSLVRKDGAITPVQGFASYIAAPVWSPLDSNTNVAYTVSSTVASGLFVAVRESVSTQKQYLDGALKSTKTGLTGYGSTTNPLCFLGTEGNAELFTQGLGVFHYAAIYNGYPSDDIMRCLPQDPWSYFKERPRVFYFGQTIASAVNRSRWYYEQIGHHANV